MNKHTKQGQKETLTGSRVGILASGCGLADDTGFVERRLLGRANPSTSRHPAFKGPRERRENADIYKIPD